MIWMVVDMFCLYHVSSSGNERFLTSSGFNTKTHTNKHTTTTHTQSELDDAFGEDFDPFKEVLGHVRSDKEESQIKKARSLTLDEMKQKRELELMTKQHKRASFTDLMGDSPLPVPESGKRTSFTDIMGGDDDFDAGFFDGTTPSPTRNTFIEGTSDDAESSSSSSASDDDDDNEEEEDHKKVVIVKVKVPRHGKAGQFVNVRQSRSLACKYSH